MLIDRWSESLAVCERAVAMARAVGARQVEGHALNTLGLDRAVIGDCANATAPLEEAIAIAREVANADDIGRGYVNLCEAKRYCGDIRGADRDRAGGAGRGRRGRDQQDVRGIHPLERRRVRLRSWRVGRGEAVGGGEHRDRAAGRPQRRYGLSRWLPFLVATGRRARRPAARRAPRPHRRFSRRDAVPQPVPHRSRRGSPVAR